MSISPIHETRLQPSEALTLDTPQASAPAEQQAVPLLSSGEDVLARDTWGTGPRTFDMQLDTNGSTLDVPTAEALDRIAAHVLSFIA